MFSPVIIDETAFTLEGIHSGHGSGKALVIMLPFIAAGSTKEGTQRLFIELARRLEQEHIDSLVFDLPPFGSSYYKTPPNDGEPESYERFLEAILPAAAGQRSMEDIILLSMCSGAVPMLNYAIKKQIRNLVVLSPHDYTDQLPLMTEQERRQLLAFRLAPLTQPLRLLRIMAEKDPRKDNVNAFWQQHIEGTENLHCTTHVIPEANYTFFGWAFKRTIISIITAWIQEA